MPCRARSSSGRRRPRRAQAALWQSAQPLHCQCCTWTSSGTPSGRLTLMCWHEVSAFECFNAEFESGRHPAWLVQTQWQCNIGSSPPLSIDSISIVTQTERAHALLYTKRQCLPFSKPVHDDEGCGRASTGRCGFGAAQADVRPSGACTIRPRNHLGCLPVTANDGDIKQPVACMCTARIAGDKADSEHALGGAHLWGCPPRRSPAAAPRPARRTGRRASRAPAARAPPCRPPCRRAPALSRRFWLMAFWAPQHPSAETAQYAKRHMSQSQLIGVSRQPGSGASML